MEVQSSRCTTSSVTPDPLTSSTARLFDQLKLNNLPIILFSWLSLLSSMPAYYSDLLLDFVVTLMNSTES